MPKKSAPKKTESKPKQAPKPTKKSTAVAFGGLPKQRA